MFVMFKISFKEISFSRIQFPVIIQIDRPSPRCSFCAKTTFYPDLIDNLVVIKAYVLVCGIPCALLMLLAYAAIFVKQLGPNSTEKKFA